MKKLRKASKMLFYEKNKSNMQTKRKNKLKCIDRELKNWNS